MSIIVTDEIENIKVYHYTTCDITSPTDLKQTRGIIKSNQTTLCKSFDFTPEIVISDSTLISEHVTPIFNNCQFFESHEGTLLRLWYKQPLDENDTGKWFLSTHRKLNAFNSKWGSKTSYGEIFTSILTSKFANTMSWADASEPDQQIEQTVFDKFCSMCDKNYVYVFLLRNTNANRIVVNIYTEPTIFCVGMFNTTQNFTFSFPPSSFIFPTPNKLDFSEYQDVHDFVQNVDPFKLQGLLLITKDGQTIKLINPMYEEYSKLRANVPSLTMRYLELRHSPEKTKQFIQLYNDHSSHFRELEDIIADITKNIFNKYINRYIKKRVSILPPCQFTIMSQIHTDYCNKVFNKISYNIVVNYINEKQTPKQLYSLVKNYYKNKELYSNGNFISTELKDKITQTFTY